MSAASSTLQHPVAVYREEQNFAWWVYALLGGMTILGLLLYFATAQRGPQPAGAGFSADLPLSLVLAIGLPAILVLGVLRMTTEVTPGQCLIWFGWVPTYRHNVPISSIRGVEVVRYRPLTDCGGWGIRRGVDGERVLNARGDQGVRLHLADGSRLLIGSQRPEELARVLEAAVRSST